MLVTLVSFSPIQTPLIEGADSMVLLSHVMQLVRNEGFELLDCGFAPLQLRRLSCFLIAML